MCGNTEVSLEMLEDYVTDILSVANENIDSTNIELQFKVCVCVCMCVCTCVCAYVCV